MKGCGALLRVGFLAALALAGCGSEDPPPSPPPDPAPAAGGAHPDGPADAPGAAGWSLRQTVEIVRRVLEIPEGRVLRDARFVDDLGGDAASLAEILAECERAFGVSIPDAERRRLVTVGDLLESIEALRAR